MINSAAKTGNSSCRFSVILIVAHQMGLDPGSFIGYDIGITYRLYSV